MFLTIGVLLLNQRLKNYLDTFLIKEISFLRVVEKWGVVLVLAVVLNNTFAELDVLKYDAMQT